MWIEHSTCMIISDTWITKIPENFKNFCQTQELCTTRRVMYRYSKYRTLHIHSLFDRQQIWDKLCYILWILFLLSLVHCLFLVCINCLIIILIIWLFRTCCLLLTFLGWNGKKEEVHVEKWWSCVMNLLLYSVDLEVWSKLAQRDRIKRIASKFAHDFDCDWQCVSTISHSVTLTRILLSLFIYYSDTKGSVLVVMEGKRACKCDLCIGVFTSYFKVNRV